MQRRTALAVMAGLLTSLSGCTQVKSITGIRQTENECTLTDVVLDPVRVRPCPALTHRPAKPTIGQSVVFDASESAPPLLDSSETLFYFWRTGANTQNSLPEGAVYAAEGPQFTHRFTKGGRQTVEVMITDSTNVVYDDQKFPNVGVGYESPRSVARASEVVNVQKLPEEPVSIENSRVSINLKGSKQAVQINESAILTLSITNLVGGDPLTAQLILEIPTGLSVNQTSFNQGGGQFTSTYRINPGETATETLRITAAETGPYPISGYVVYTFGGSEDRNKTKSSRIQLRFFDSLSGENDSVEQ